MTFEDETIDLTKIAFNTRHEFYNCVFEGCHLNSTPISNSLFEECSFRECDLSNCSFTHSTLNDCTFTECKFLGINWTSTGRIVDLKFKHSNLSFNVFSGMDVKDFIFDSCLLAEIDFSQATLDRSVFIKSKLTRSVFNSTSLRNCDLTTATDYSINPVNNQLKGASFDKFEALSLLSFFGINFK